MEQFTQWLCGCGEGSLRCKVEDVPDYCPICEYPIRASEIDNQEKVKTTAEAFVEWQMKLNELLGG